MKLTMRARALGKKFTLIFTAYVLAVSSLTASVPFILSQEVFAAPVVSGDGLTHSNIASEAELRAAIAAGATTINLGASFIIDNQVTINRTLTLNGNGATLSARAGWSGVGSNDTILAVTGGAPTINNIIVDGANATGVQGIQVYAAAATLNNVTARNNAKAGIHVNSGSIVTVHNVTTSNNSRGNSLLGYGSFGGLLVSSGTLTVTGLSTHTNESNHIRRDGGKVDDVNKQYNITTPFSLYTRYLLKPAPAAPTITTPAEASVITVPNTTVTWSPVSSAHTYNVIVDGYTTWGVSGTSLPVNALSEGSHTIQVQSVAKSGLAGGASAVRTFTVDLPDTTKPSVTLVTPTTAGPFKNSVSLQVDATDNEALSMIVANIYQGSTLKKSTQTVVGGATSGTHTTTVPLADGTYYIKYNATDASGNVSATAQFPFIIDSTAPTITVTHPVGGQVTNGNFTITGTANDANGVEKVLIYVGKRHPGGGFAGYVVDGEPATLTGGSFSYDVTNLPEFNGTYYVRAVAHDAAGNTKTAGPDNIKVDTTPPAVPVLTLNKAGGAAIVNGGYTNAYNVVANWTGDADAVSYTYAYWNDIPTSAHNATTGTPYTVTTGATSISGEFNQGEGKHYMQITARDAVGNTSTSNIFEVTYDKTPPTVDVPPLSAEVVNGGQLKVKGTIKDLNLKNYTYQIVDENKENNLGEYSWSKPVNGGNVENGELLSAELDNLRYNGVDYKPLPDGNYFVRIWADDKAENRTGSTPRVYVPFTIDRTNPVIVGVADGDTYRGSVTFDVVDDNFHYVTVDGVTVDVDALGASTYRLRTPLSGDGAYVIEAFDQAGNSAGPITVNINNAFVVSLESTPINSATATPIITGYAQYLYNDQQGSGLLVDGVDFDAVIDSRTPVVVSVVNGIWSLPVTTPLANGSHVLAINSLGGVVTFLTQPFTTNVVVVDEEETIVTTNSAPNGGLPFANFGAAGVLGLSDTNIPDAADDADDADIKGSSTEKTFAAAVNNTDGNAMGLAWYWWLLIIAGVALLFWWIAAAARRRQAE